MRAMKDSGIPWIGEIPKGWNCARMKQIGKYVNGYAFKPEDWGNSGKPIIRIQDLTGSNNSPNYYEGDIDEKYLIKNGDILVSWAATLDAFIWGNGEGWLNQHIFKAIPNTSIQKDFFFWLLKVAMSHMNNDNKHGIVMQHLTLNVFGNFIIPIPPLAEQQRIAEFLDRKCAEVDEMIALQEQIIEELKAYKQSVITEAVTKGLNPAAPMRDSGIEWIGSIPEHWEVRRIKFIGKAENGLTYSPNDVCDESEGILVLRSSNIQNGKLAFDDNVYVRSVPDSLRVRVGDIIICSRNGSASLVGKSALVDSEIDASFGAFMMRFRSNHNHKYIHFLLTATISHYKQLFTTTTINQLTIGLINNIAMPFVEDATEQQAIADYLDEKCADIDSLIQTKQSKIDSLKEYKKSIIYEYVTGKREVNE